MHTSSAWPIVAAEFGTAGASYDTRFRLLERSCTGTQNKPHTAMLAYLCRIKLAESHRRFFRHYKQLLSLAQLSQCHCTNNPCFVNPGIKGTPYLIIGCSIKLIGILSSKTLYCFNFINLGSLTPNHVPIFNSLPTVFLIEPVMIRSQVYLAKAKLSCFLHCI